MGLFTRWVKGHEEGLVRHRFSFARYLHSHRGHWSGMGDEKSYVTPQKIKALSATHVTRVSAGTWHTLFLSGI
jgi:hypothetical protein